MEVGDSPEQGPGTKLGSNSSSNTGSIVGGGVWVAAISFVIAIGFFLRRRRRGAPPRGIMLMPNDEDLF